MIDPVLSYSTYFGGNSGETAWTVAVDTNGFVYVAGQTFSTQFTNCAAFTPGRFRPIFQGGSSLAMRLWPNLDNQCTI